MEQGRFNTVQMDALKEVFNMGAGNAATALSMLLSKQIEMTVPSVNLIEFNNLLDIVGDTEVTGIIVRVLGDIPGSVLIIFEKDVALDVVSLLIADHEREFSELGNSALCEIGNILSGSYMNSISQFTGLSAIASVPAVTYDMLSAILSTAFVESGQYDEYILDIETVFLDKSIGNVGAHFYYIPVPGSIEKILETIGLN